MPWSLKRFHESGQAHFITFCCYHRHALFLTDTSKQTFETALERIRRSFQLSVYGYVVMPEHVHLLLSESQYGTFADALKSLKQAYRADSSARRSISGRNVITTSTSGITGSLWRSCVGSFSCRCKSGKDACRLRP